ncbi:hypothetical protein SAMN04487847_2946 [Microbacterium sp. cf332]|nr:hypothetical protein SAMN04487847_2946 [Microbacterium sp. cf332]
MPGSEISNWFPIVFGVVSVLIVLAFVYVIYAIVRNRRVLRRAGRNPDTIEADVANALLDSQVLRPRRADLESQLAEIDRLAESGAITAEERAAARLRILSG